MKTKKMNLGLMAVLALAATVYISPRQASAAEVTVVVHNQSKQDLIFFVDTYCTNGDDYTQIIKARSVRKLEYSARRSGSCFFDKHHFTLTAKDIGARIQFRTGNNVYMDGGWDKGFASYLPRGMDFYEKGDQGRPTIVLRDY